MVDPAATVDLRSLASDLMAAGANVRDEAEKTLDLVAEDIVKDMKSRVPRKTGRLQDSIDVIVATDGRREIGPVGVEYAPFIEYGTGSRGEFPTGPYEIAPKFKKALAFSYRGKDIVVRKVMHPGIKAQPYARPAAAAALMALQTKLTDVGISMITRGKK